MIFLSTHPVSCRDEETVSPRGKREAQENWSRPVGARVELYLAGKAAVSVLAQNWEDPGKLLPLCCFYALREALNSSVRT